MYFKGDIIITDPCYIVKEMTPAEDTVYHANFPKREDFIPAVKESEPETIPEDGDDLLREIRQLLNICRNLDSDEEKAYQKAIEEYEEAHQGDWDKCKYGEDMGILGIKNYISSSTEVGDWSCLVFNSDNKEELGKFCADAGMVGVFLLDEVLKYNPDFDYHTERPWTTTLIKGFDGDIEIVNRESGVSVEGRGNINFASREIEFPEEM